MPPQRKALSRRFSALSASFYDRSGAIGDGLPSPRARTPRGESEFDGYLRSLADTPEEAEDEGYTLTAYGEMSLDEPFTLPPSPTQTIKYRYRAYRPKLAKIGKKYRAAAGLKTKSSAYHAADSSLLASYLAGTPGRSTKRDFQALMQKYRDSAEGWRDTDTTSISTPRKLQAERSWSASASSVPMGTTVRRTGSGLGRASS